MELLLLSHTPTRILEEGFIPAALELKLKISILTDCVSEHLLRAKEAPVYRHCQLIECDIFNPLAVARLLSVHELTFSGVLATDASSQACAAVVADYLGLPGPSWRSALLCDQRAVLRNCFAPEAAPPSRWIVHCAEPRADIDAESFPVTVQPLETGRACGGRIAWNPDDLTQCLAELHDGYALVEQHRDDDEVYALDGLGTPDGFVVLCGSRIQFDDDEYRTKRVQSFMPRPPHCDVVLALLAEHDLGLGRHHVEYAVTDKGIRIREMHNGLHDDASEFALAAQLDGDLFRATIKLCLGMPVKPPHYLPLGTTRFHPVLEATV